MARFTAAELEEMRRADEEIERDFRLTNDDLQESRARDKEAVYWGKDTRERKIAAQQAAYREANREKYNDYMREYMREYRRGKRRKEV